MVKPKILLHVCCGPCQTHCIEELEGDYEVIAYYYNPNIHPEEEYERRKAEFLRFCEKKKTGHHVDDYNPKEWHTFVKGLETEPERGKRCLKCFELRLKKSAEKAEELGIKKFTTTLSISPFKDFKQILEAGKKAEEETGIVFLEKNFKKADGFKKSVEISKKYDMKRQDYCGCVYSMRR